MPAVERKRSNPGLPLGSLESRGKWDENRISTKILISSVAEGKHLGGRCLFPAIRQDLREKVEGALCPFPKYPQIFKAWYWTGNTYINSVATGDITGTGAVSIITGGIFFDGTRNRAQLANWDGLP